MAPGCPVGGRGERGVGVSTCVVEPSGEEEEEEEEKEEEEEEEGGRG